MDTLLPIIPFTNLFFFFIIAFVSADLQNIECFSVLIVFSVAAMLTFDLAMSIQFEVVSPSEATKI